LQRFFQPVASLAKNQVVVLLEPRQAFCLIKTRKGGQVGFAADDGLDTSLVRSFEKFYRSKKVAVVCNGACRRPFCLERVEQPVELARAIQKAVLGVHV